MYGAAALADDHLVALLRLGHLSALGTLFDRHARDVRQLLRRLGVNHRDVDDLVQETFLECAAARFETGLSVRSWLFGIAIILERRHRQTAARALQRTQRLALDPQ